MAAVAGVAAFEAVVASVAAPSIEVVVASVTRIVVAVAASPIAEALIEVHIAAHIAATSAGVWWAWLPPAESAIATTAEFGTEPGDIGMQAAGGPMVSARAGR